MNAKEQAFAAEYLKDKCGKAAAIRAGYAPAYADRTASRLLHKPDVAACVEVGLEAAVNEAGVTREWITSLLKDNAERAMTAVPVLDKDGAPIGEYRYEGNVANRAAELLGKDIGMFGDKLTLTINDLGAIITQIVEIINDEVPDAATRERIAARVAGIQGKQ